MSGKRGRPHFGYFIFDCPSDHEVNGALITESDLIRSVLVNNALGGRVKSVRFSTAKTFNSLAPRSYPGVRYVHVAGHGTDKGLAFIGGRVLWEDVADKLAAMFPVLGDKEQRVLSLSCCFSQGGVEAMKPRLKGHFSAAYHLGPDEVGFSDSIAIWGMFYLKKRLSRPHGKIMADINAFFGAQVIFGTTI